MSSLLTHLEKLLQYNLLLLRTLIDRCRKVDWWATTHLSQLNPNFKFKFVAVLQNKSQEHQNSTHRYIEYWTVVCFDFPYWTSWRCVCLLPLLSLDLGFETDSFDPVKHEISCHNRKWRGIVRKNSLRCNKNNTLSQLNKHLLVHSQWDHKSDRFNRWET